MTVRASYFVTTQGTIYHIALMTQAEEAPPAATRRRSLQVRVGRLEAPMERFVDP